MLVIWFPFMGGVVIRLMRHVENFDASTKEQETMPVSSLDSCPFHRGALVIGNSSVSIRIVVHVFRSKTSPDCRHRVVLIL